MNKSNNGNSQTKQKKLNNGITNKQPNKTKNQSINLLIN